MSFNARLKNAVNGTGSLNINGAVAGTITGGKSQLMREVEPGTLSALVTVDAETNTIELFLEWEVSNDGTTWRLCAQANNAATVKLATGTGGADASVTRVVPANASVYGWRYARASIRNEVVTGTSNDTYDIAYNYARREFAD